MDHRHVAATSANEMKPYCCSVRDALPTPITEAPMGTMAGGRVLLPSSGTGTPTPLISVSVRLLTCVYCAGESEYDRPVVDVATTRAEALAPAATSALTLQSTLLHTWDVSAATVLNSGASMAVDVLDEGL